MTKIFRISPEQFAISVNTLRGEFSSSTPFKLKELKELFKEYGLPNNANYLTVFIKRGIIRREKKGEYHLPAQPVYKGVAEQALKEARSYLIKDKSPNKEVNPVTTPNEDEDIRRAVDFLKSKGFLILRQV